MQIEGYPNGLMGAKASEINGKVFIFGGVNIHTS